MSASRRCPGTRRRAGEPGQGDVEVWRPRRLPMQPRRALLSGGPAWPADQRSLTLHSHAYRYFRIERSIAASPSVFLWTTMAHQVSCDRAPSAGPGADALIVTTATTSSPQAARATGNRVLVSLSLFLSAAGRGRTIPCARWSAWTWSHAHRRRSLTPRGARGAPRRGDPSLPRSRPGAGPVLPDALCRAACGGG
jgi:hypothetical protein